MKKMGIKWFIVFAFIFLTVTGVLAITQPWRDAPIDHGTLGVADTSLVKNILQITTGDPVAKIADIRDWIPCWGVNPWSRDGQWIVYQSQIGGGTSDQKNEICIIKADGTGYQRLTDNSDCDTHGNFTHDGTKIVFQRGKDSVAQIWIMDKDGSNQQSLTQVHGGPVVAGGCEQKPVISPDGTKIAFRVYVGDDELGQIWVMNIDGTNPVKVSGAHDGASGVDGSSKHSWSPDSQWILFSAGVQYSVNAASRIFKVRPTGANLTMLSEDVDAEWCENWAAWSPDGKWISYHRRGNDADDLSEIWIMRTNGTNKEVLVSAMVDSLDPEGEWICAPHSWHPSSKWIVFKKWLTDSPISIINVNTKEINQLTQGYRDGRMWWGPDGKHILFKEYSSSSSSRDGGLYNYDLLVMNLNDTFSYSGDGDDEDPTYGGPEFGDPFFSGDDSGGYCFIATAAFGSPLAGQVKILRQFRDKFLLTNALGKKFVSWYYRNGPVAASWIKDKPLAKVAVQAALYPLIGFSFLLIAGYLPFVTIGFLLSAFLFLRFRPKQLIAK